MIYWSTGWTSLTVVVVAHRKHWHSTILFLDLFPDWPPEVGNGFTGRCVSDFDRIGLRGVMGKTRFQQRYITVPAINVIGILLTNWQFGFIEEFLEVTILFYRLRELAGLKQYSEWFVLQVQDSWFGCDWTLYKGDFLESFYRRT